MKTSVFAVLAALILALAVQAQEAAPADNLLTITGTVVEVREGGAAVLDVQGQKVLVLAPKAAEGEAPVVFKVGDSLQISGIVQAVTVQAAPVEPQVQQARFKVGNILCGACSASVKAALLALPGVQAATVSADAVAEVTYDAGKVDVETLTNTIIGAKHPHQGMHFTATLLQ